MRGESATGDDCYSQPLPHQLGSLGTYEERDAYPYVPAENQDPANNPVTIRCNVSVGISEALAK